MIGGCDKSKTGRFGESAANRSSSFRTPHSPTGSIIFVARTKGDRRPFCNRSKRVSGRRIKPTLLRGHDDGSTPPIAQSASLQHGALGAFAAHGSGSGKRSYFGVMSSPQGNAHMRLGVRMALGAQTGDIIKLVGAGHDAHMIGLGLGLVASFALTRLLSSWLYGVSAIGPATCAASRSADRRWFLPVSSGAPRDES